MFCEACSVVLSDDEILVIAVLKTVPLDISQTFVELCGSCSCENADGEGVPQIGAAQQESGRTLADAQLEGCFAMSTRRQGATTSSLTDTCAVFCPRCRDHLYVSMSFDFGQCGDEDKRDSSTVQRWVCGHVQGMMSCQLEVSQETACITIGQYADQHF